MILDPRPWFAAPLAHLGDADPTLRGIYQPLGATDRPRGVTDQFLAHAADYDARYANVEHFRVLIADALARIEPPLEPVVILDIGSGAGNSVIPLLDRFADARVVASDISAPLLAILRDRLEAQPEYAGRCALVCVDAGDARWRAGAFDLVVGAAILHHVADPRAVVASASHALRPGGAAIFFEPFALGHAVLRLAYADILAEAARRGEQGPGFDMLRRLHEDYVGRRLAREAGRLLDLDDKWMFTRRWFESVAHDGRWAECLVHDIHPEGPPLLDETRVNLHLGMGLAADALPAWAWSRLAEAERAFTEEARDELVLEAGVVLRTSRALHPRPGVRAGWWFEPRRPGRGFFVAIEGDAARVVCCHYDAAGEPVWDVAGPVPLCHDTLDAGTRTCDVAALAIATSGMRRAHVEDVAATGGVLRLRLENDTQARLDWRGEALALSPQHAQSPGWLGAPGSGLGGCWIEDCATPRHAALVEYLDTRLFAALLDASQWRVTVATRRTPLRYAGQWLRYAGGQAPGAPYRPPGEPRHDGDAAFDWLDDGRVVATLPGGYACVMRRAGVASGRMP